MIFHPDLYVRNGEACVEEKVGPSGMVRTLTPDSNEGECFSLDYGSVCLPPKEDFQGKEDCAVNVATSFRSINL